jgi:hypothetical protein
MKAIAMLAVLMASLSASAGTKETVTKVIMENFPEVTSVQLKRSVVDEVLPGALNPYRKNDPKRVFKTKLTIDKDGQIESLDCRVTVFTELDFFALSCGKRHEYYVSLRFQ